MSPGATSAPPRPTPPVDPRLRARRIAVRRDEGRRRLRRVAVAAAVAVVVLVGAALTRSPLLDVDRVDVSGGRRTAPAAVVEAAGIRLGDPMVDVDVAAVADRVESLPWVASASVARRWPGRLVVEIIERTPVAVARNGGGGWVLVDGSGRLLEEVGERPPELPALEAVASEPAGGHLGDDATEALTVAAALPASLVARVDAISAGGGPGQEGLRLELRPAGAVQLGDTDDLEEKLLAVVTVLADIDPAAVATLDVRVPTAPVLTRRG